MEDCAKIPLMTIYFVRHGESVNNVTKKYQGSDVELSEVGYQQAEFVADRFKNIPVDVILASSYTRAHETAKIIGKKILAPIEVHDSLVERKRPSLFHNHSYDHPEFEKIRHFIDSHPDPKHHHSDEENFFDVKKRAEDVIKMLEKRPEENIVIVSHGVFIKAVLFSMILKDSFNIDNFQDSLHILSIENTAMTIAEFTQNKGWKVKTINDFAHLAD
jgi:broad specificity phosphatase PhoE